MTLFLTRVRQGKERGLTRIIKARLTPTTSAQRKEQVRILIGIRRHEAPIGSNNLERQYLVSSHAVSRRERRVSTARYPTPVRANRVRAGDQNRHVVFFHVSEQLPAFQPGADPGGHALVLADGVLWQKFKCF